MARLIEHINKKIVKLDQKDKNLLYELCKNARQGISKLAKKIGCSKQTTLYRLNKLISLGVISNFITIINYGKLDYNLYNLYLKIDRMDKKKETKFCNLMKKDPSINRIISGHGNFNYILSLLEKNNKEFNKISLRILNKANFVLKDNALFIITEIPYQISHQYLFKDQNFRSEQIKNKIKIKIKKIDLKLLQLIAEDARSTTVELAKKLKISRNRIKYKIDKLEEIGLIQAYIPIVDTKKLGYECFAVLLNLKNIDSKEEIEFFNFLKSIPFITYIAKGIGRWNLIFDLYAKDMEHFNEIKYKIIDKFPKIIKNYDYIYLAKEYKCNYFPQSIFKHE